MKAEDIKFTIDVKDEGTGKIIHLDRPINLKEMLDGDSFTSKNDRHSLPVKDFKFFSLDRYYDEISNYYELHVEIPELKEYKKIKKIERELKTSIVNLFKSLKNGIYKFDEHGYICFIDALFLNLKLSDNCIIVANEYVYEQLKIEDYGKTWASTKEELKNGK